MTYFQNTPIYQYELDEYLSAIRDITLRIQFKEKIINSSMFQDPYTVVDGDTPEKIAYAVYGSTFYHWIILLANDIIDPYTDWPIQNNVFDEWVEEKYKHLNCSMSSSGVNGQLEVSSIYTRPLDPEDPEYDNYDPKKDGSIQEITIVESGTNYKNPIITIVADNDTQGQGAYARVDVNESGQITHVWLLSSGTGYVNGKVKVEISDETEVIKGADRAKYYLDVDGVVRYVEHVQWGTCWLPKDKDGGTDLAKGPDVPDGYYAVSYREFERILNDQKRNIVIPKKELLGYIISEFDKLITKIK